MFVCLVVLQGLLNFGFSIFKLLVRTSNYACWFSALRRALGNAIIKGLLIWKCQPFD